MDYPFPSLQINGRDVMLRHIAEGKEAPRCDFEKATFLFIQRWMEGQQAFTLTTSGSTGTPKTITVTRDQMVTSARMTAEALGLQAGYRALVCLDTKYIAGQMMLVRCFTTGMHIVAVTPSANPFRQLDSHSSIDFTALVPYQVYDVLRSAEAVRLHSLGTLIIGGAALDAESRAMLQQYACACYATYGMTETLSHVALQKINGRDNSNLFRALPGVILQTDSRGCLTIEAPHLPEKVITNDLVELISADTFRWLGRWDNVINTGGIKVIPEKVEDIIGKTLGALKLDYPFFICGIADAQLGKKIILVLETVALGEVERSMLYDALRRNLVKHEVPKEIMTVYPFIRTETGKIHRSLTEKKLNK